MNVETDGGAGIRTESKNDAGPGGSTKHCLGWRLMDSEFRMIIVDNALKAREAEGRPIRVALIGAGFISQGLGNHIVNTTPGMRLVGVYNRRTQRAFDLCEY